MFVCANAGRYKAKKKEKNYATKESAERAGLRVAKGEREACACWAGGCKAGAGRGGAQGPDFDAER